jgi:hypothetical protein
MMFKSTYMVILLLHDPQDRPNGPEAPSPPELLQVLPPSLHTRAPPTPPPHVAAPGVLPPGRLSWMDSCFNNVARTRGPTVMIQRGRCPTPRPPQKERKKVCQYRLLTHTPPTYQCTLLRPSDAGSDALRRFPDIVLVQPNPASPPSTPTWRPWVALFGAPRSSVVAPLRP